jgi:hypothetical protein
MYPQAYPEDLNLSEDGPVLLLCLSEDLSSFGLSNECTRAECRDSDYKAIYSYTELFSESTIRDRSALS